MPLIIVAFLVIQPTDPVITGFLLYIILTVPVLTRIKGKDNHIFETGNGVHTLAIIG